MSIQIKLPDIGGDEVEVTEILVNVGDKVEADQSLLTVEGDKASMEIPAPQAGVVKSISVKVGDKVKTGVDIMVFDAADGAVAPVAEEPKVEVKPTAAAMNQTVDVNVPDIGGDEVEVTEILVKVGDTVAVDDSLITVEGDKASMEVPSSIAGVVKNIVVKVGDKVKTGSKIMEFETATAGTAASPSIQKEAPESVPAPVAEKTSATSSTVPTPAKASTTGNDFVENEAYAHV